MATVGHALEPSTIEAELTRSYLAVRKTGAEALTRATSAAWQRKCQDRITRLRRQWDLLDVDDLAGLPALLLPCMPNSRRRTSTWPHRSLQPNTECLGGFERLLLVSSAVNSFQ